MLIKFLSENFKSKKNRPLSFIINFLSMTLALTAVIIIYLHVNSNLNHDRKTFTDNMERVVRLEMGTFGSLTPGALAPFVATMPEVESTCALINLKEVVATDGLAINNIMRLKIILADSSVFNILPYRFSSGDPQTALNTKDKAVVTRSAAARLFGTEDVIGRTIKMDNKFPVQISAVIEDIPSNSLYVCDVICNRELLLQWWNMSKKSMETWNRWNWDALARLKEGVSIADFNDKYSQAVINEQRKMSGDDSAEERTDIPIARKFHDAYFASDLIYSQGKQVDKRSLEVMMLFAVLILFIAIINYINIYTARSTEVIRSMGIKAIFGANKSEQIGSIIGDAILTVFLSSIIAYIIALTMQPLYVDIIGENIPVTLDIWSILGLFVIIPIVTGILSGLYPALALTRQKPIDAIARLFTSSVFSYVRSTLIVLQFATSIALIASTLYINRQINYISDMNLGLNRENIVVVSGGSFMKSHIEAFRENLLQNPLIIQVTTTKQSPIDVGEFSTIPYGDNKDNTVLVNVLTGDEHTFDVLGIRLVEGELLNREAIAADTTGSTPSILINQTMANMIRSSLGRPDLTFPYKQFAGVFSDFQHRSVTEPIGPVIFKLNYYSFINAYIKISGTDIQNTLSFIENTFKKIYPNELYEFNFLDKQFDEMYKSDQLLRARLLSLSILAIIIGCLGLFALVSYSVERRRKEIAIRKVYGATIARMVIMLCTNFLKWLLISFVIAVPVVWWAMTFWVSQYMYRVNLSWWIFAAAGIITTFIALGTVIIQTYLSAAANPSKAIKSE